jgi:DNA-binding transcriptional regulator LsrR (DeoR family)
VSDDARLLAKVATLYYKSQLPQHEIAHRLGMSRQTAGRLLQRARDLGIVHVEIRSPLSYASELEWALEEAFGLAEAVVVQPHADTDESIKEAIGKATAEFVQRRIKDNNILALGWGTTVFQCALYMQPARRRNVIVVELNGSLNRTSFPTHAEYIIHHMAEMLDGKPIMLGAPMFVERPDIRASLLSDSRVAAAFEMASQSDIALFGIGDLSEHSSPFKAGFVDEETLRRLRAQGVVGDIGGRFYDAQGNPHAPDLAERTIAVELSNLRAKAISVGMAGGLRKVEAILGALHGKYCNVLITDEQAASALLSQSAHERTRSTRADSRRGQTRNREG